MTTQSANQSNEIQLIDFFGRRFKFNFSGKSPDYRTPLGGFFTILMFIITTPIFIIFWGRWIDTSKPTVSVINIIKNRTERYQLIDGNIFIGMALFNGVNFVPFDQAERYATLRAERVTRFEYPPGEVREYHSPFPYVHCTKLSHNVTNQVDRIFGALDGVDLSIDGAYCPDYNFYSQWYVGGSPTQLPYTRIVFKIYPCSLETKADCVGVDALGRSQFIVPALSSSMKFDNFSAPVRDGFDTDLTPLYSLSTQNKFTMWLKRNKIYDDRDSLSNGDPKFTFFNVEKIDSTVGTRDLSTHCTEISIEDGSCLPYITIEVRVSKIESVIERRYYKFFSLVSDVGGMTDIVFYVFAAFYVIYVSSRYKNWVILQFYGSVFNTEELGDRASKGINDNEYYYQHHHPDRFKRTQTIQTSQLLKNTKKRNLVLKRLMKKMDVITYIKFSQKAFILTKLAPCTGKSYYEALSPLVYFNLSKKLKQRKEDQKKTNFINNTELTEAYKTLAKSRPKSQFEEQIKYMFMKIVEGSGKIDRDTIALIKVVPEADSILESSIREEFDEEEEEKIENEQSDQRQKIIKISEERPKSTHKKVKLPAGRLKKKMIVKSSFRNRGTDQSLRLGRNGSKIQSVKKGSQKRVKSRFRR